MRFARGKQIATLVQQAPPGRTPPLTWWRKHLSASSQRLLAMLWPWSLIAFLAFGVGNLELAVLGNHQGTTAKRLASFIPGLLALTILTAYAHDVPSLG